MSFAVEKERLPAIAIAVLLHAGLFLLVRPATPLLGVVQPPPKTYFGAAPSDRVTSLEHNVRTLWSPVLFALPSGMGFSRELLKKDVETRLSFSQEVESERFLTVDPAAHEVAAPLIPPGIRVAAAHIKPRVPSAVLSTVSKKPAAPRVYIEPGLKSRLEGGVVLPPALNQNPGAPWEVRAVLCVSADGRVEHVFLEKPLEQAALNQQVLQLLYGLHFKSGPPLEGSVELYSPESTAAGVAE